MLLDSKSHDRHLLQTEAAPPAHWQVLPEQTRLPVQIWHVLPQVPVLQTHALLEQCLLAPHA